MVNHLVAIDDESAFLPFIERVADTAGFSATATTEAARFKEAVTSEAPDVVLLDLQMPGCDGVELLRFLSDSRCAAKIFLISGFDPRVLELARRMGESFQLDMADPLQKPVRPQELRQILTRLRSRNFVPDAASLREAIQEHRLTLHYQPLVELRSGETVGFEALVRWEHPDFGLIMPDRFIKLAEQEGLIDCLTQRVVSLAVGNLSAWRQEGFLPFVSVNMSAANIVDPKLPERLEELCLRRGVPTDRLCFELTETAAMGNPGLVLEVLTRLRLKGFRLAIDDFGTGYSSMLQLHRLPFSELKIDQSFVREMGSSHEARVMVGLTASLAKSLGLEMVAEGIDSPELVQRLVEYGCNIGQGYYFSRPMPPDEVAGWVAG